MTVTNEFRYPEMLVVRLFGRSGHRKESPTAPGGPGYTQVSTVGPQSLISVLSISDGPQDSITPTPPCVWCSGRKGEKGA